MKSCVHFITESSRAIIRVETCYKYIGELSKKSRSSFMWCQHNFLLKCAKPQESESKRRGNNFVSPVVGFFLPPQREIYSPQTKTHYYCRFLTKEKCPNIQLYVLHFLHLDIHTQNSYFIFQFAEFRTFTVFFVFTANNDILRLKNHCAKILKMLC